MKIDLEPCAEPAGLSLDITERDHHIDFPITGITAGKAQNIPIPGLSIAVPKIGNLGVDAAVLIQGNPDELTLKVTWAFEMRLVQHVVYDLGRVERMCATCQEGSLCVFDTYS